MTLTKGSLVNSIRNHFGLSRKISTGIFESLFEIMKDTLENGEDVLISGFGKFCVRDKSERRGRNPQTGNEVKIGAKRVVTFRCSIVLRDKINGKGGANA